jgi:glycosyltransferase involved in cell wall biosynthesis
VQSLAMVGPANTLATGFLTMTTTPAMRAASKLVRSTQATLGVGDVLSPSGPRFRREIARLAPDVVHVHWTYGSRNPISLSMIRALAGEFPLVWTFHDMWPVSGGCTNSQGCERWRSGCGDCPLLGRDALLARTARLRGDPTTLAWRLRRTLLSRSPFTVVAPSAWMDNIASNSPILARATVVQVPNALDLDVFRPRRDQRFRTAGGIPPTAVTVGYAGKPGDIDYYRGRLDVFRAALTRMELDVKEEDPPLAVLLIGRGGERIASDLGCLAVCIGAIERQADMARWLAACDLFVSTTQFDNYPGIIQEAMACGVPVVASRVGGVPELVHDGVTGVLCDRRDTDGFAAAIQRLRTDAALRAAMGEAARSFAKSTFESRLIAERMRTVYEDACDRFAAMRGTA